MNDAEILQSLARHAEQLYPGRDGEQAMRLSGKMADDLLQFISAHPEDAVRLKLAENSQAPAKFRPGFAEMAKKGLRLRRSAFAKLTMEDLDAIMAAPLRP